MSKNNLVIVESPAKAKTIKKYLGSKFDVVASMGHVRDLPKSRLGVDLEENFEPSYSVIKDKREIVKKLKEKASKSDKVILATDPDREGEAIAWHLSYILKLDPSEENRVTFNEITKSGVKAGMQNIRRINSSLVDSQQARRVLDRLVGYKLSPFLCQKIHKGLSAGRVQSVALKILSDREKEIAKFKPEEYWTISAVLNSSEPDSKQFISNFWGKGNEAIELKTEEDSKKILDNLKDAKYIVSDVKLGKRKKNPPAPFVTSTLQQEAVRKLNFTSRKTMKIAQELYEGLKIEEHGFTGLITYMRTDSTRVSDEAVSEIYSFIEGKWGSSYLPEKRRVFKKSANAQDAHEAIRPSIPSLEPSKLKGDLSVDQYKLYKLIWDRFTASQMSSCLMNTVRVKISANDYIFKSSGSSVEFDGFTVLYEESKDSKEEEKNILPELAVGQECELVKLENTQHFTEPPPRFSEASLIKTLEENGVGRPSTYSSIISTILSREYVINENKKFFVSELGIIVNDLLEKYFSPVVDAGFTAKMETDLDQIESGKFEWRNVIKNFYDDFANTLEDAKEKTKDLKIHLKEDETDEICDLCGSHMVVKRSRFGKFLGCSNYPECKNIKKISKSLGVKCHKCGGDIVKKLTKTRRNFYGCSNYPKCDFASWYPPTGEFCPKCGEPLFTKGKKTVCLSCDGKD